MVYVLDNTGKALMPTERHGKVRRLLRDKQAHVVRLQPFTVQLDYESKSYTQEVTLGVDAGSVHIGISATTKTKELFASEFILRTDVVKKISDRRELRRCRRFRKTRYRAARFDNRRKKEGWLPPSIIQKVNNHIKTIQFVHSILPVCHTIIEVAQFDIQKLKNCNVQGAEYQQGEQTGFWNVREYVLARDGHKCQHCGGKSGDKILNIHHLESRRTGGNSPDNLITLCKTCHKAYHCGEYELPLKISFSLRSASIMNLVRWSIYWRAKEIFGNVHQTYGYFTKHVRIHNNIEKTHCADAFCISRNINAKRLRCIYMCKYFARHTRVLHASKPKKGGLRQQKHASHWIGKTKFQKYDTVMWNGMNRFIYGSTHGRLILRDVYGTLATPTETVNAKAVKFVSRTKGSVIMQKIN
jgi:hypothetical protein